VDVIHSPSATFNLEVNQLIDDLKDVKKVMWVTVLPLSLK
jgi:hypothetical protein